MKLEKAKGNPLPKGGLKEGVIFSTYAALMGQSKKMTRLDQMIEWLGGKSADGCILFDESHKAKVRVRVGVGVMASMRVKVKVKVKCEVAART